MFDTLKQLFSQLQQNQPEQPIDLARAMAILLFEVANADDNIDINEENSIANMLKKSFSLTQSQADELLKKARKGRDDAISMQQFTSILLDAFDRPQRISFIRALWQVAYADGKVDVYEEHLIRKISELLYLNHSDYIKTKLSVLEP